MKKNALFILFLHVFLNIITQSGVAQQCPKLFIEAKYKEKYFSGRLLSQQYPLIGLYKQSLIEEDKLSSNYSEELVSSDSMEVQNAYPYIYNALKSNDIVILNECHNIPLHRALLYTILDSFKAYGIQSVFLEALAYAANDSLYYNKYPNENFSGNYMSENVYNQALRKIFKHNLTLYSYEFVPMNEFDTISVGNKKYVKSNQDVNGKLLEVDSITIFQLFSSDDYTRRDVMQALHIYQKLISNDIKKAFIYCGYSHEWKAKGNMAGILQRLLNKNVFSIDQMLLNERSDRKYENPLYKEYASNAYPVVLLDKTNRPLHSLYFKTNMDTVDDFIDMVIASPRAVIVNNRPNWLELGGDRKRYALSKFMDVTTHENDFLAIFYDADEFEKGGYELIPMDAFQVSNGACNYDAILTPGKKYHLIVYQEGLIIVNKVINTL